MFMLRLLIESMGLGRVEELCDGANSETGNFWSTKCDHEHDQEISK